MRERLLGPQHLDTATTLHFLAMLYRTLGRYDEAEPFAPRTLSVREQQLGPNHPHTADILGVLAIIYYYQGKYAQAEPLYQRVLQIYEQQLGETHPRTMNMRHNLALLSMVQGRDRGEEYAAAARLGAPQATQCADRFHLAQNLTKIVEEILARCRSEIRKALKTETSMPPQWSAADAAPAGSAHLARHAERTDRYHQLLELRKAGLTLKEIAHRLGMGERTVRYWLNRGIPYGKPELRHKRRREFDRYVDYVRERWNQGEHNGLQLWRELQAQGYKGSWRTVYRLVATLREQPAASRGKAERAQAIPEAARPRLLGQRCGLALCSCPSRP